MSKPVVTCRLCGSQTRSATKICSECWQQKLQAHQAKVGELKAAEREAEAQRERGRLALAQKRKTEIEKIKAEKSRIAKSRKANGRMTLQPSTGRKIPDRTPPLTEDPNWTSE